LAGGVETMWKKLTGSLAALIAAGAGFLFWESSYMWTLGAKPKGERLERIKQSPNHDGKSFEKVAGELSFDVGLYVTDIWRARQEGRHREPPAPLPFTKLDNNALGAPIPEGIRVTWLGHSSLLIEVDGVRVLTDPVFSERASPFKHMGPKRFHPVPTSVEELPAISAVLISHDHYDHLDAHTIAKLAKEGTRFLVPLGIGAHLESWGVDPQNIKELDWWDRVEINGVELVATPAAHFSGRGINDRFQTLFASWAVIGPTHRLWFSGDTGLSDDFHRIGDELGPFDLAMAEVGAWNDAWPNVHLGPVKAMETARRVKAKKLMPIHWGTFDLSTHAWDEPAVDLSKLAAEEGLPLFTPRLGIPLVVNGGDQRDAWWEEVELAAR